MGIVMLDLQVALHVFLSVLVLGTLWRLGSYHLAASDSSGLSHLGRAMTVQY
jgi:hypothetical protein